VFEATGKDWQRVKASGSAGRGRLVARAITWNTAYQIFQAALGFGAMLILVRVIPPAEYGRFGAVLGLAALLNSFSITHFASHALQLPDGREPDWSLHWSAGLYIQASRVLACHLLAGICWLVAPYRQMAPLLSLVALGLLLEWPAEMRVAMLRREMDFRRLKLLFAVAALLSFTVTLTVGLAGGGVYALLLGSNVVQAIPSGVDLLVVRRWRPRAGWWRWPDWAAYRPALRFGFQQASSLLLWNVRGAAEAAVLPWAVGYAPIGLMNRAQALLSASVGRAGHVLLESAIPLLPRYAGDPKQYAQKATLFVQVLLLAVLPGALYVGLEGRSLSRLLYGERWIAADPLIWPATVGAVAVAFFSSGSAVLLAAGRLRTCLVLDALAGLLAVPMVAAAWTASGILAYAWGLATAQLVAGVVALTAASPLMARGWPRSVVLPPAVASLLAMGAVLTAGRFVGTGSLASRLVLDIGLYGLVVAAALRGLFPAALANALSPVPGGERLSGFLGLPRTSVSAAL